MVAPTPTHTHLPTHRRQIDQDVSYFSQPNLFSSFNCTVSFLPTVATAQLKNNGHFSNVHLQMYKCIRCILLFG